ncbi:MAG: hypothetical protein ABSD52_02055 [Candidatus Cybelea sp.]
MQLALACRRRACIMLALLSTMGCARTQTTNSLVTPLPPSPNPYVTYMAADYSKPGQPTLTANEVAQIREVLALVKPCQVGLLRYAFPA